MRAPEVFATMLAGGSGNLPTLANGSLYAQWYCYGSKS